MRSVELIARLYGRFFEQIPTDSSWAKAVREAANRGPLVHVLRNVSLVDYLALEHLTERLGLPPIGYANDLGPTIEPLSTSSLLKWVGLGRGGDTEASKLEKALSTGHSAVLFLKAPPDMLTRAGQVAPRRRAEGEALLQGLMDLQRREDRDIILLPQTFLWTQRPEQLGFSVVDTIFGPADFPGEARASLQVLLNYKNAAVRAGEPLSLREFLTAERPGDPTTLRRLTYVILRRVERERRAAVGPAQKPADRLREEVIRSPKLQAIIRDLAGPGEEQHALLTDKARDMLKELATAPDPETVKALVMVCDPLVERLYAGIDVDEAGLERLREAARKGSVVLLPSHKSHVDYLLLSYVFRKRQLQTPVIAAGDNLSFFPVGPLFRRAGAFFIRRSFKGDRLYTAVVDAYVRRLLRDGHTIEFFLEGGRSRTGKLLTPKLGLLNMVVDAALSLEDRTVSFVPVSIGYERMMEEGVYARELSGMAKRKEDAGALLKATSVLREKYGRANIQFGEVLDLGQLREELGIRSDNLTPAKRRALVSRLGHRVMSQINQVTAVTPGSLVALALLCHRGRGMSHVDLVDQCARLANLVKRLGARTTPSLTHPDSGELRVQSIREATAVYVRGGLVRQHVPGDTLTSTGRGERSPIYKGDDVIYTVPDDRRLLLDLSKNIIQHLFVDRALVSLAMLAPPGPPAPREGVRERVQSLSRLFKLEFMFRADASFDTIFDQTVGDMVQTGELALDGDRLTFGPGHEGLDGRGWVTFYAATLRNFVEGYRIAARTLALLTRGSLTDKELVQKALRAGEQMFLGGEIERSEAVSQPILENAFGSFLEQGYLRKNDGKVELTESFASESTAQAIEAKITAYLARRSSEARY